MSKYKQLYCETAKSVIVYLKMLTGKSKTAIDLVIDNKNETCSDECKESHKREARTVVEEHLTFYIF